MSLEFRLPDLGEGLTEAEIARWFVEEGQEIEEDDPLVEVETDKTSVEIASPVSGTVAKIHARAGELVPVGTVIVVIETGLDSSGRAEGREVSVEERQDPAPARHIAAPTAERTRATPLVRRIAAELNLDLAAVQGTGPGGQITETDVRTAAAASDRSRRVPLRGTRRRIAEHLSVAHREIPAVTFVEECDFSGIDLTRIVALTMKSAAVTLRAFPALNARLEEDVIVELDRIDIAVAVQTDDGLVVPVVRNCDSKSVEEIAEEVRSLAERARARSLEPRELRDSTFTVSNGGRLGGLLATPLINHPEVAILGLHRIVDRPVVVEGEVAIRPIGNISLTFDHRVVDGMTAASFVGSLIGQLHELSR